MAPKSETADVSFAAFFLVWAKIKHWHVPDFHVLMAHWLENKGEIAVLRVFRGAAKSTMVALYEAWKLRRHLLNTGHGYRFTNQAADDPLAYKLSRDVKHVLKRHPLCKGLLPPREVAVQGFSIIGHDDERNPSVSAAGVLSNVTGARSDEFVFDDCEVPKNIKTPEARDKLRTQMSEATHILVPGGSKLYIGTPHTHESIYAEQQAEGADALTIPLFRDHVRFNDVSGINRLPFAFHIGADGLYVMTARKLLVEGEHYRIAGGAVVPLAPLSGLVDLYAGNVWPERFTRGEIAKRRKQCKTTNEWDSQYQLQARPIHNVRLDPDKLLAYDVEPTIRHANGGLAMHLGKARIVGASAYWDVAAGKINSDASVLSLVFTDERGNLYWHRGQELTGEVFSDKLEEQTATQCGQVIATLIRYQIPGVVVENNGLGIFVPALLRRAAAIAKTNIAVREVSRAGNKDEYILEALEIPMSGRYLWAHTSLWGGKMPAQMRDWIPGQRNQPDDYLDSVAGAIRQTPVRIGKVVGDVVTQNMQGWSPSSGVHEVALELN